MGLLSGLMGMASGVDAAALEKELGEVLVDGEVVEGAYRLIRDMMVFTNKRLILIDKQGMTGRKTAYTSIPYGNISQFAIETAGSFDADSELRIWVRGTAQPLTQEFGRGGAIHEVHRTLGKHVLK